MKKFLVVYRAPVEEFAKMMKAMETAKPEDREKNMKMWRAWMDTNKSSLTDPGAPVGKTKQISSKGIKDTKNDIGGYSLVQADSHAEAAEIFKDNPHLEDMNGATIEVMEIVEMEM